MGVCVEVRDCEYVGGVVGHCVMGEEVVSVSNGRGVGGEDGGEGDSWCDAVVVDWVVGWVEGTDRVL